MPNETMKKANDKNWFIRHKFLTIFIILPIALILIVSATSDLSQSRQNNSNGFNSENIVENEPTIPGISAVDVYGNLKNKGFVCSGPDVNEQSAFWACKEETNEHTYIVEILGKSSDKILSIQASSLNMSSKSTKDISKDFLAYLSTVTYDNSKPEEVKKFVSNAINKGGKSEIIISGVKFGVINNDKSVMLNITPENSKLD
jgi:hypothetical protein